MYGDLLLTPEQEKLLNIDEGGVAQGFLNGVRFWPNAIVPYELDFRLSKYPFSTLLYCACGRN